MLDEGGTVLDEGGTVLDEGGTVLDEGGTVLDEGGTVGGICCKLCNINATHSCTHSQTPRPLPPTMYSYRRKWMRDKTGF